MQLAWIPKPSLNGQQTWWRTDVNRTVDTTATPPFPGSDFEPNTEPFAQPVSIIVSRESSKTPGKAPISPASPSGVAPEFVPGLYLRVKERAVPAIQNEFGG